MKTRPGGQNSLRPAADEGDAAGGRDGENSPLQNITPGYYPLFVMSISSLPLGLRLRNFLALCTRNSRYSVAAAASPQSACVPDGDGSAGRGKSGVLYCPVLNFLAVSPHHSPKH